jgi:DDE domain
VTKVTPVEVTTDQAPVYPVVLEELLPAAWHRTDRYANNCVECDHGRLKARLRPMRGLKQDLWVPVIRSRHATCAYSWISPPSRSRRTTLPDGARRTGTLGSSGGACPNARCGRWPL